MHLATSILTGFVMLAALPTSFAKYNKLHMLLTSINTGPLPVQTVELPIDHFGGLSGTFKNRWWYNDTFYQPGGPVFVEDAGEGDAEPVSSDLHEVAGTKTAVMQLAQKYNGLAIVWEHRYYGKSVPFVQNGTVDSVSDMNAHQWSFLSLDQALEDVVIFANNFTLPPDAPAASRVKAPDALHASKTPWVFIGGSYPGVRAATLRQRNPETIFASWASSAPVQAQVSMASYYDALERAMPHNCSIDFSTAIKFFDDSVKSGNDTLIQLLKNDVLQAVTGSSERVTFKDSDESTPVDIAEWLRSVIPDIQNDGPAGWSSLCDALETDDQRLRSSSDGLAAQFTPEEVWVGLIDAITAVTDAQNEIQEPRQSPIGHVGMGRLPSSTQDQLDSASWHWQFCAEFGFFQIGDPTAKENIVSTLIDVPRRQAGCEKSFSGMLPSAPKVENLNKYGGWNTNVTRVFFSNGEFDPWRTLSVASVESNAPQRKASTTVPSFDAQPDSSSYYGAVYPGQVHVSDFFFSTDLPKDTQDAFNKGLSMMTAALDAWLPHFTPGSNPIPTSTGSGSDSKAASTDAAGKKSGATKTTGLRESLAMCIILIGMMLSAF